MTKSTFQTSKKERLGYYNYFIGQNIIYMLITMFLSVFYVNTLGISAATVGTILLVARVWDAINDPMLSIVVEKSNLKGGKFKPWIKAVSLLMPLSTILIFSFVPILQEASMGIRITYATVTYILWGMIYTVSDAPAMALATVMTDNQEEKTAIFSFKSLTALLGILIAMISVPVVLKAVNNNWFTASIIISILAYLFLFQISWTKERIKPSGEIVTIKQIVHSVRSNKYLIIFCSALILSMATNFGMALTPFVASDVIKSDTAVIIINMLSILPSLIVAGLMPKLVKKFGKNNLFKFSLAWNCLLGVIIYFAGYKAVAVFYVLLFLRGMFGSFTMVIGALFFADTIEYDYHTTGRRFEAATFAVQTFSNKAIGALSGAIGMWLLALVGYVAAVNGVAQIQTEGTVSGIWAIYNLGPIVGNLLSLFVFWKFYDLTDEKIGKIIESNKLKAKAKEGTQIDVY